LNCVDVYIAQLVLALTIDHKSVCTSLILSNCS